MKFNILHLTPEFNQCDGRSYYVYLLLKYLTRNGHRVFFCTNRGDLTNSLKEYSIPIFAFKNLSNISSMLESLQYLSSIIKKYNIQILHSHHRYYELLSNLLKGISKIRTVFTALSIVDKRYFVEYKSDKIIAVSNSVKNMLTKNFKVDESKINLIPNFVDSEELELNMESKNIDQRINNENIRLLSIGRFHKEKNYETLLKAISLLQNYSIELILIGKGEEESFYKKFIKENSLNVKIISPRKDLKQYFDASDICILTSIRDPLPGFMLQSGLHRKPFIGSNVDGISELILDSENGLLFEKQNAEELAVKIKLFIENKKLAKDCAENLNIEIMNNYTEKSVIPKIEELYFGLLK